MLLAFMYSTEMKNMGLHFAKKPHYTYSRSWKVILDIGRQTGQLVPYCSNSYECKCKTWRFNHVLLQKKTTSLQHWHYFTIHPGQLSLAIMYLKCLPPARTQARRRRRYIVNHTVNDQRDANCSLVLDASSEFVDIPDLCTRWGRTFWACNVKMM